MGGEDALADDHAVDVVARGMGKPCVAGAAGIKIDPLAKTLTIGEQVFSEGDVLTLNGSTGEVFGEALELIDLEPAVRDAMLLTMPTSPVCSEDCEGLCTGCGVKWAELGSDHTHETMDPRWAALRERFGGNEEEN